MENNKAHYVVVTGIVIKDGKYLITKRADWEKAFPGKWTVPGGKLVMSDYSSKPKDTKSHWYNIFENLLRREIKEEINLEIKNISYITSCAYIRDDGIPTRMVSLFADYDSGEIKLCHGLTEYAWVNLEEAKDYDLIEGIYEEVEMLGNYIKTGKLNEWKNEN